MCEGHSTETNKQIRRTTPIDEKIITFSGIYHMKNLPELRLTQKGYKNVCTMCVL